MRRGQSAPDPQARTVQFPVEQLHKETAPQRRYVPSYMALNRLQAPGSGTFDAGRPTMDDAYGLCSRPIIFMASAIIDPTSATLAGSTIVFPFFASSPNCAMYCSATRSCTAS